MQNELNQNILVRLRKSYDLVFIINFVFINYSGKILPMDLRRVLLLERMVDQEELNRLINDGYQMWYPEHPNAKAVRKEEERRANDNGNDNGNDDGNDGGNDGGNGGEGRGRQRGRGGRGGRRGGIRLGRGGDDQAELHAEVGSKCNFFRSTI